MPSLPPSAHKGYISESRFHDHLRAVANVLGSASGMVSSAGRFVWIACSLCRYKSPAKNGYWDNDQARAGEKFFVSRSQGSIVRHKDAWLGRDFSP